MNESEGAGGEETDRRKEMKMTMNTHIIFVYVIFIPCIMYKLLNLNNKVVWKWNDIAIGHSIICKDVDDDMMMLKMILSRQQRNHPSSSVRVQTELIKEYDWDATTQ